MNNPVWIDDKGKIVEPEYCRDFLSQHPMRCINDRFYMDPGNILLASRRPDQYLSENIFLHKIFLTRKFSRNLKLFFPLLHIASIEFIRLLFQIFLYFSQIAGGDSYMAYRLGIDLLHLGYQDLPYPVPGIGQILVCTVLYPGDTFFLQIFPYFLS